MGLLCAKLSSTFSSVSSENPSAVPAENTTTLPPLSSSSPSFSSLALGALTEGLRQMLVRSSLVHRIVASLVISFWGRCPDELLSLLSAILLEQAMYEETMPFLAALQRDCHVSGRGTVLYCTVCTLLYCNIMYCIVLYCTVLYCTVMYCTALYCMYCTVLYVLYCTVLYCNIMYCIVL